jgi:hypothetical protein
MLMHRSKILSRWGRLVIPLLLWCSIPSSIFADAVETPSQAPWRGFHVGSIIMESVGGSVLFTGVVFTLTGGVMEKRVYTVSGQTMVGAGLGTFFLGAIFYELASEHRSAEQTASVPGERMQSDWVLSIAPYQCGTQMRLRLGFRF